MGCSLLKPSTPPASTDLRWGNCARCMVCACIDRQWNMLPAHPMDCCHNDVSTANPRHTQAHHITTQCTCFAPHCGVGPAAENTPNPHHCRRDCTYLVRLTNTCAHEYTHSRTIARSHRQSIAHTRVFTNTHKHTRTHTWLGRERDVCQGPQQRHRLKQSQGLRHWRRLPSGARRLVARHRIMTCHARYGGARQCCKGGAGVVAWLHLRSASGVFQWVGGV